MSNKWKKAYNNLYEDTHDFLEELTKNNVSKRSMYYNIGSFSCKIFLEQDKLINGDK